jgi:hypothetical protein
MSKPHPIEFSAFQDNVIDVTVNDGQDLWQREVFGEIEKIYVDYYSIPKYKVMGNGALASYCASAGDKQRWFDVRDFPTARKALAAAKQWVRDEYAAR